MEGVADLLPKIISQCGILNGAEAVAIIWLALQLAAARKLSESDRATYMKLYNEQNAAYEKLAVSHAKVESALFSIQMRNASSDND